MIWVATRMPVFQSLDSWDRNRGSNLSVKTQIEVSPRSSPDWLVGSAKPGSCRVFPISSIELVCRARSSRTSKTKDINIDIKKKLHSVCLYYDWCSYEGRVRTQTCMR